MDKVLKINEGSHGNRVSSPPDKTDFSSSSLLLLFFFCPFSRRTCESHGTSLTWQNPRQQLYPSAFTRKNEPSSANEGKRHAYNCVLYLYFVYIYIMLYYKNDRIVSDFYPKGFTDDVLCFFSSFFFFRLRSRKSG